MLDYILGHHQYFVHTVSIINVKLVNNVKSVRQYDSHYRIMAQVYLGFVKGRQYGPICSLLLSPFTIVFCIIDPEGFLVVMELTHWY